MSLDTVSSIPAISFAIRDFFFFLHHQHPQFLALFAALIITFLSMKFCSDIFQNIFCISPFISPSIAFPCLSCPHLCYWRLPHHLYISLTKHELLISSGLLQFSSLLTTARLLLFVRPLFSSFPLQQVSNTRHFIASCSDFMSEGAFVLL